MNDIYTAPDAELGTTQNDKRVGGNIEDAISGRIEVRMRDTLGEAWHGMKGFKLKCHLAFLLLFAVILGVSLVFFIAVFAMTATGADESVVGLLGVVLQIVIYVMTLPMSIAVLIMAIRHSQGKTVTVVEVFRYFGSAPRLFLVYLLQSILVGIGFLLLILPGIYLSIAYMFALPLVVEKKMSTWQALEASRKAVTKIWFRFFGFLFLLGLVNMLGVFTLGISWIWTLPWAIFASALIYIKLFGAEAHTLTE